MVLNTFKDRKVAEISTALSVEQHGQIKISNDKSAYKQNISRLSSKFTEHRANEIQKAAREVE